MDQQGNKIILHLMENKSRQIRDGSIFSSHNSDTCMLGNSHEFYIEKSAGIVPHRYFFSCAGAVSFRCTPPSFVLDLMSSRASGHQPVLWIWSGLGFCSPKGSGE